MGVDPKESDGIFGLFCCELDCNGGEGTLNCTAGKI